MKRFTAAILFIIALLFCVPAVSAQELISPSDASASDVSASDVTASDIYGTGKFVPAEYLPSFASVPYFYTKVENLNNLYMFVDVFGNAYKRRYGSIDGVYGWYEATGPLNEVADHSFPVNVQKDESLLSLYNTEVITDTDSYIGILPPEENVSKVSTIFGVEITEFLIWALTAVFVFCALIIIAAICRRGQRKRTY